MGSGLLCAAGRYDADLAVLFLGVTEGGFSGGRLSEYLDGGQLERVGGIAAEVHAALRLVGSTCGEAEAADSFGFLLRLKAAPLLEF